MKCLSNICDFNIFINLKLLPFNFKFFYMKLSTGIGDFIIDLYYWNLSHTLAIQSLADIVLFILLNIYGEW